MGKPGRAHLRAWLVPGAASVLVLAGVVAAGPAQAAVTSRSAAGAADTRRVCAAPGVGHAACMALVRTDVKARKGLMAVAAQSGYGYGPSDLQSAYDLPSASAGSGETVAIVDAYDDPDAEADLQVYRAQYGLPVCDTANGCFQKVNQEGQASPLPPPAGSNGWDVEESLDIDMVSAICPNCDILLVEADSNNDSDLYTAEDTAVSLGAKFVSNSWSEAEYSGETQDDQYFNHPGVAITAAAGDDGYGTQYPAASPYVTAVGGTTLTRDPGTARGWSETVWGSAAGGEGTGSGCSAYEPKPSWQQDTGCANRTVADVSADANPATGVAVYDSYSEGGWLEVGGTSVATPVIASTYALAGTPETGSNPASYPYSYPAALNDVTSGANGTCSPAYLCTAGPGYDGPTGLGTPDGLAAFIPPAPRGEITGQITTAAGAPISGATVSVATNYAATTSASGDYELTVPAGSYTATVQAFGYKAQARGGVQVSQGQATTENFTLATAPAATLSGTVTDGSGHKWPVYAQITISGDPSPVYTSPYTGAYSVSLPQKTTYTLSVSAVDLPGYATSTTTVRIGTAGKAKNIKLDVDQTACTAPGYAYKYTGTSEQFTGWTGSTPQDGWTVTANPGGNGDTWEFGSNPTGEGTNPEPPGSDGQYAIADSNRYSSGTLDTSLISPVVNLSGQTSPEISFDSWYDELGGLPESADVDLSLDGGQTWTTVWQQTTSSVRSAVTIVIPQAADQSDVQVRFHYIGTNDWWWSLDNVFIGNAQCAPVRGGLIAGQVTDGNTDDAVDGATVSSVVNPGETGTTADSPEAGDGFYELFAAGAGSQQFTAADGAYTPATAAVDVAANAVTRQDWVLQAGRLAVTPGSISASESLGGSKNATVALTNTGTESVQVQLGEEDGGFTPAGGARQAAARGAPLRLVKGHYSATFTRPRHVSPPGADASTTARHAVTAGQVKQAGGPAPADTPWADIADYPTQIQDNAVAENNGTVYSVDGYTGEGYTAAGYVYEPSAGSWSPIADAPAALGAPAAQFINGILYLAGGIDSDGNAVSSVYAYDPSSDSWSQVAGLPEAVAGPASAVVDGQLYVVGGCTTGACSPASDAVYSYDPGSSTWTQHASYPAGFSFGACAGLGGQLVCAGGTSAGNAYTTTWIYDPGSNTWTQGANMPYQDWGATYAAANGQLVISGGATDNSAELTNQAASYDPSSNTWTLLPNVNTPVYRGGGACGYYAIGGATSGDSLTAASEVLPGYDSCGGASWLSESTPQLSVAPGQTAHVTVTLDSALVSQPGTYTAQLTIDTNTPYTVPPVSVSLRVKPPPGWGELTGTVTDAGTGDPIGWATVQICTLYDTQTGACGPVTYTLATGVDGSYQLWLDKGYNPLLVDVSADGYQSAFKVVKITAKNTATVNFALTSA